MILGVEESEGKVRNQVNRCEYFICIPTKMRKGKGVEGNE